MRLPDLVAYQAAVQHPATAFADPDLQVSEVTTNRLGLPRATTGNFAVTYQLRQAGRNWAVRCFHREASADRAARYTAISRTLTALHGGPFVTIAYLPTGVRVNQTWYPVTKMPWLDGRPFNRAVEASLADRARLNDLERCVAALADELRRVRVAHGDLQHGNILVDRSGGLHLVDYDGMYVPALRGLPASEAGDPNYQHPGRGNQFDAELDRFAVLVIVVALRALTETPDLWHIYNTDDNLLFRYADFRSPGTSALFRDLQQRPGTQMLAERLARVCEQPYAQIPLLADFLRSQVVVPATAVHTLRLADVSTLNRLYSPKPVALLARPAPGPGLSLRKSWTVRRAVAQEALAFAPHEALLASADRSGKVRLRDAHLGRVQHVWTTPARVTALAFSADGERLVATGPGGQVNVWEVRSRAARSRDMLAPAGRVRSVAFGPTGPLVAVVAGGPSVSLWTSAGGHVQTLAGGAGSVRRLVFSPDGRLLVAGSTDGSLRCWAVPTATLLAACSQSGAVGALAVSTDGRRLASAGADGVRLWDVPGGRAGLRLGLPGGGTVEQLAFAPDGSCLAAAMIDARLVVWNLVTCEITHNIAGPGEGVSSLVFSPDGRCLAVSTSSGAVSVRALSSALGRSVPGRSGARAAKVPRHPPPHGLASFASAQWLAGLVRKVQASVGRSASTISTSMHFET
jgi:WD40 repeat protein